MSDKKKKIVINEEMDVQTTFNEDDISVLVEEGEVHNDEDQNGETEE